MYDFSHTCTYYISLTLFLYNSIFYECKIMIPEFKSIIISSRLKLRDILTFLNGIYKTSKKYH